MKAFLFSLYEFLLQAEILISSKFSVWSKYMKKEENTPNADSNGLKLHKIKNP